MRYRYEPDSSRSYIHLAVAEEGHRRYEVIFVGPDAERLAREYVAWKNGE